MGTEGVAEKLAAELRPIRQQKFRELRALVNPGPDPEEDFVCNKCLNGYNEACNQEFSPKCFLSTDIEIRNNESLQFLDQDELNQFWVLNDAIAWAKVEIDWEPRWYQLEPLRCTARRKVFRMGRQIGKTEILAILALYHLATKPDFRVVILCPYQDQVDLIFGRIRKYIQRSQMMSDPDFKIRDKMNPHEIEFYHPEGNSSVIGITAGVRTGQKGDKARGQTPHLLIIDEADMLDDETLEAILAMLTGTGEIAQMVISSTPTGRRGNFFKWSTNRRMDFKEFHFPSMVSPHWTKELELFYRETYSENGFAHEFLAEFGELEVGLFQHKYIEASMFDYSLRNAQPQPGEMYSMGVDWNRKGIGVHVVITGYSYETSKYRVAYKEIIDAGQFTQHKAVQRIAALNQVWDPEFIYVDEGDGTTQVEALHLWGMKHPNTRLHRKVKGIDFGKVTFIRDPLIGKLVKKKVKPLMVDLCVRRVESLECVFPKGEDTSTGLVGQMRDFCVVRYGRDGQPVFSDDKEHTLVAWMLSIYAVIMECSDIAKARSTTKIAFTGPLGDASKNMVNRHELRAVQERKQRLTPQVRSLELTPRSKAYGDMGEFFGIVKGGRSVRNRIRGGQTRSGYVGRPKWDKKPKRGDFKDL